MTEQVCSDHENAENVVTTGVHLLIRDHHNPGALTKIFRILEHYKRLYPTRAKEIEKTFEDMIETGEAAKFESMVFAICHDLGVKKPRHTRSYVYLAHSYRINGKIRKIVKYVGVTHEKLSMKDLFWLMTGKVDFKDVDEWRTESEYHKWRPLHNTPGLNLTRAMHFLISRVGFAPCACDYLIQHGYPVTFKQLFDQHGLTGTLTKEAVDHARKRLNSVWQEPTKYYSGTLTEMQRVEQFLKEQQP